MEILTKILTDILLIVTNIFVLSALVLIIKLTIAGIRDYRNDRKHS